MHLVNNSLRLYGYPTALGMAVVLSIIYKQVIGIRMSNLGQC